MTVDYIETGNDESPLILLREGSIDDYKRLVKNFNQLITHPTEFDLFSIDGVLRGASMGDIKVQIDEQNFGVSKVNENSFLFMYSVDYLKSIISKIEHYLNSDRTGFQWLDDKSSIGVVLSQNGRW